MLDGMNEPGGGYGRQWPATVRRAGVRWAEMWRAGLRRAGTVAAVVAGCALLAAACGSPALSATGIRQTAYQRELAYAQCMRAHDLPGFPDPASNGAFATTLANCGDFHGPVFDSANKACAHLQGPGITAAQQEQATVQLLKHAACMRAHGITHFPNPSGDTMAQLPPGVSPSSPRFVSATRACQRYLASVPGLGG